MKKEPNVEAKIIFDNKSKATAKKDSINTVTINPELLAQSILSKQSFGSYR